MFEVQSNLSFNWQAAWEDFVKRIVQFADEWGQVIADTADANRQFYFDFEMKHEVYGEIGKVIVDIFPEGAEAWQAWLEEFGKGSLMADESENPYIGEYKRSQYWNPLRGDDPTIVGREEGEYIGIDGRMHTSTGSMAGLDLEQYAARTGNEDYMPSPPTFFIRDAVQSNRERIYEDLRLVILTWMADLPKYFTS
jgi:hypothetical protein